MVAAAVVAVGVVVRKADPSPIGPLRDDPMMSVVIPHMERSNIVRNPAGLYRNFFPDNTLSLAEAEVVLARTAAAHGSDREDAAIGSLINSRPAERSD